METINGTKNPLLKILKEGDVVMVEVPSSHITFKQIIKLKNLRYQPADNEFNFDWLEFDCDILYVNQRMHKDLFTCWGNCLSITEIIPTELIEIYVKQHDMWRSDLYLMSDIELEAKRRSLNLK